jgi:hypothetical protein
VQVTKRTQDKNRGQCSHASAAWKFIEREVGQQTTGGYGCSVLPTRGCLMMNNASAGIVRRFSPEPERWDSVVTLPNSRLASHAGSDRHRVRIDTMAAQSSRRVK